MTRSLLPLLALLLLSTPASAETCPDIGRTAGGPVYAILYGFPYAPAEYAHRLETLQMVDRDLVNMAHFFSATDPARMYIHGEPTPELLRKFSAFGVRPPTWRSLHASVGEVIAAIDAASDPGQPDEALPEVYIYLAGHGVRSAGPAGEGGGRLVVFGRPEPGTRQPGYDGRINSALIADQILTPLAERARVHLIADTCFSYHLLETRDMKRSYRLIRPPPLIEFEADFTAAFPGVGAHLATRATTPEDQTHGGVFSHAVRSMAIGPADLDRDGVLTYGEMDRALAQTAEQVVSLPRPTVVAPGLDRDAPFIDWRRSKAAARVCVPDTLRGRRVLAVDGKVFATVRTSGPDTPLWLPRGQFFGLGGEAWAGPWLPFAAVDGMLQPLDR